MKKVALALITISTLGALVVAAPASAAPRPNDTCPSDYNILAVTYRGEGTRERKAADVADKDGDGIICADLNDRAKGPFLRDY